MTSAPPSRPSAEAFELSARVQRFVDEKVSPLEKLQEAHESPQLAALAREARALRLWGPQLPRDLGGGGLTLLDLAPVLEAAGRSLLGPLALGCAAPDEGNGHLLDLAATPSQRQRYLEPLARGELRSAFAMTEPAPGAGADPSLLATTAVPQGEGWSIRGHKWFATGARGAAFIIVAARTGSPGDLRGGLSLFLVPGDAPGLRLVRDVPMIGDATPGGHCELELENVFVARDDVLGKIGEGYRLIQARLGPARLTHCMRWIGAAGRALEIATRRAEAREAFGKSLAEHQAIAWMLADSATELHAGRLLVLDAAAKISAGDRAKVETSMCKVFVAETVDRVLDRAIQICGALGLSGDLPLSLMSAGARAFRIYDGPSEVHRMVIARRLRKG